MNSTPPSMPWLEWSAVPRSTLLLVSQCNLGVGLSLLSQLAWKLEAQGILVHQISYDMCIPGAPKEFAQDPALINAARTEAAPHVLLVHDFTAHTTASKACREACARALPETVGAGAWMPPPDVLVCTDIVIVEHPTAAQVAARQALAEQLEQAQIAQDKAFYRFETIPDVLAIEKKWAKSLQQQLHHRVAQWMAQGLTEELTAHRPQAPVVKPRRA